MSFSTARVTASVLLLMGGVALVCGQTVPSLAKRQQTLERAKSFVAPREITPVEANPFNPPAFAEAVAAMGRVTPGTAPVNNEPGPAEAPRAPTGPRSDRELLQAMAQSLKPSGYIVLGGEPSISFGQKRVKAGGVLTITFEGAQYTLEVVSIDRTNFTLRLNREEFTRTIK